MWIQKFMYVSTMSLFSLVIIYTVRLLKNKESDWTFIIGDDTKDLENMKSY